MSKKVVRGFLRSDGKPNFSNAVSTKPGELEYLMQHPVHYATLRSPIIKGMDTMITYGVRRLPITDATGSLMGIVTATDMVNFLGGGDYYCIIKVKHGGRFFSALNEPLESITTKNVIFANICESFAEVLEKMVVNNKGAVPIVKDDKELVGILTEHDVVKFLSGRSLNLKVGDRMTRNPVFASPEISIGSTSKLMVSNGFRRLPIKKGDDIVGIATTMDIVRYFGEGRAFRRVLLDEMDQVLSAPVSDIMRTDIVTVDADMPLGEVAPIIAASTCGAVLVKESGAIAGIFTERDLLAALAIQ
jgi:CBS domain-containing protein